MKKNSVILFGAILLIYAFFFFGSLLYNQEVIFPNPNKIIKAFFLLFKEKKTYKIFSLTIFRLGLCLLIAFFLATILSLASFFSESFRKLINPIILFFKSIPVVAISIIILGLYGYQKAPYIITVLMVFPIVYQALYNGFKNIKKEYIEVYSLDSTFNFLVFKSVHLPAISPFLKTAFLQSLGLGIKVMVMSEFLAQSNNSIGTEINKYKNNLSFDYVFAWSIILIIIIAFIENLTKKVFKNL